jgi:hypothetical protein
MKVFQMLEIRRGSQLNRSFPFDAEHAGKKLAQKAYR